MPSGAPLHGIRILEVSALGPAAITMPLIDLGAEVIKVEPPAGDYIREMTWPIVEGVSLMHLHINRGKRSIVMDLRTDEDIATFKELAKA
jgi:crotonobetainyl-CoA:carnitine CoA-transferase CaiB-like acyl-CoA transferase